MPVKQTKASYVCSRCGCVAGKWLGKCPECSEFNTMVETAAEPKSAAVAVKNGYAGSRSVGPVLLDNVDVLTLSRMSTGMNEFDRVLGGGLVKDAVVVLGGNPGAGKSTLLLQVGCTIARQSHVIYFSGEESSSQIKCRKERLGLPADSMLIDTQTNVLAIGSILESHRPHLAIIDSIQTTHHPDIESVAGSVAQVKGCAAYLTQLAKHLGIALILVGHIIKSDVLAGPQALRHIVDAVLMLSSTEDARYRILRAEKNRFGNDTEIGVFAMTGVGLRVVDNPSAIFLSRAIDDAPGTIVTPLWEGTRPMLVEVQALLDKSVGTPRRVAVGLDDKRLAMLLAVLNKHSGLNVSDQDVYANIVGGVRVTETSADLPILLASISSMRGTIIPSDTMAFGEVGLSGEVRPCSNGQDRMKEAAKLGFRRAVVPLGNVSRDGVPGIEVIPVATLAQAADWMGNL
jgi:DNA repair protein RadA/Sms